MIEEFIDSALIIDDKKSEVTGLVKLLESRDIFVRHYTPLNLKKSVGLLKNRKIVFLDLFIDEGQGLIPNIALIRSMLTKNIGKSFGTYGLVLWTKHIENLNEFKQKIQNDGSKYDLPLFIIGLDKTKYLKNGKYSPVFIDINKQLKANVAANFFIGWESLVRKGKDRAIENIFSLARNFENQNENLKFILFQLAKNYTGIPSEKMGSYNINPDAVKAFNDMLHYEIMSNNISINTIVAKQKECFYTQNINGNSYLYSSDNHFKSATKYKKIIKDSIVLTDSEKKGGERLNVQLIEKELLNIYSNVNSKTLIDTINLDQKIVFPGNVYEIIDGKSYKLDSSELPENAIPIIIELTPPCDFANTKAKRPRVISGFIKEYSVDDEYKGDSIYKEIWPIALNGKAMPQMIVFDFRYINSISEKKLQDKKKFKLILRTKDKLFADILQKFAAHTARLGLSIIH